MIYMKVFSYFFYKVGLILGDYSKESKEPINFMHSLNFTKIWYKVYDIYDLLWIGISLG
jgi:hypothetical protein